MDCAGVATHLVTYHFAASDLADEERDAIDAHLLECKSCLETYLSLKRAAEKRPVERPSPAARARLRAEVAATFAPEREKLEKREKRVMFLVRRIPLYQGIAAAAVAAALALVLPGLLRGDGRAPSPRDRGTEIDTARPRAASLTIY